MFDLLIPIALTILWFAYFVYSKLNFSSLAAICFSLVALSGIAYGIFQSPLYLVPSCFFGLMGYFFHWYKRRATRRSLSERAHKRLKAAEEGLLQSYFLFLRSFEIDDSLPVHDPDTPAPLREAGLAEVYFEERLAACIHPIAPLVALGRTGTALGATRIEVGDEEWEKRASELMEHALAIFLVPGLTKGMLWEIEQIVARRYLTKTVFVLPPRFSPAKWLAICDQLSAGEVALRLAGEDEARRKSNTISRCLYYAGVDHFRRTWPRLDEPSNYLFAMNGRLFMLDESGSVSYSVLLGGEYRALPNAVRQLVKSSPWSALMDARTKAQGASAEASHKRNSAPLITTKCPHCGVVVATSTGIYPCCRRQIETSPATAP